jgi:hypothetical protein
MIPEKLYITPAYTGGDQGTLDKKPLERDAWDCWDRYSAGDVKGAMSLLLDWTQCRVLLNDEAKLVMTYKGQLFLDVYRRLGVHCPGFVDWVRTVYRPGAESVYYEKNNRGAWGLLGCALADRILNRPMLPHIYRYYHLIAGATDNENRLYIECKRTNSGMWYSYFFLAPLLRVSQIIPTDPWMLYGALDWLWQYILNPDSWPYRPKTGIAGWIQSKLYPHATELERPRKNDWPGNLYQVAGKIFGRGDWSNWAESSWRPPFPGVNIFRDGAAK